MEIILSLCVGIGLSAACGFRVFVPPLVMSFAAIMGHLPLGENFAWIGTYPALIAFAIATVVEVAGYYIPVVDHLLDVVATPTAIAVGTLMTAAVFPDADPLLKWTLAAIAGGGSAGIIQSITGITRLSSTAITVGLGNSLLSTIEGIGSVILSVMAIFVPFLAVGLVSALLILFGQKGLKLLSMKRDNPIKS